MQKRIKDFVRRTANVRVSYYCEDPLSFSLLLIPLDYLFSGGTKHLAQFDPELKDAFLTRWILKRRAAATEVIRAAVAAGELAASTNPEVLLDVLYGGLYYWLLIGMKPPAEQHVQAQWDTVMTSTTLARKEI